MSNIYIQEPATNGKVTLKTTLGDIDIELWSREAPKACRNFVQLCLEGYYDDTIFHRVIKGFIAQGGDPTGTGLGGESIYGTPFKDEFHSRLRFVRRGLVAMANAEKDSNGSQFFFTLGACPELQDKHTIFGKVAGQTLYNMIRFDEIQVDQNERPNYPPKVISAHVIYNPFDDIVPRKNEKAKKVDKKAPEKPVIKGTKDFKLLSFGDEAEEDEEEVSEVVKEFRGKGKSSHDLLDDPKLSSIPAVDPSMAAIKRSNDSDAEDQSKDSENSNSEREHRKKRKQDESRSKFNENNPFGEGTSKDFGDENLEDEDPVNDKFTQLQKLRSEVKALKKSVLKKPENQEKDKGQTGDHEENPVSAKYRQQIMKYKEQPKLTDDERFARFEAFRAKIKEAKAKYAASQESSELSVDEALAGDAWLTHRMVCEDEDQPVLAKDANLKNDAEWFDIHDPRHPMNVRRRENTSSGEGATRARKIESSSSPHSKRSKGESSSSRFNSSSRKHER